MTIQFGKGPQKPKQVDTITCVNEDCYCDIEVKNARIDDIVTCPDCGQRHIINTIRPIGYIEDDGSHQLGELVPA